MGSINYMNDSAGGQPQPGQQAMPPANPVASGEAEAGPAHFFPYDQEEMIGGDSVLSIQTGLLSKYDFPSAEQIESARMEARQRFRMKVDIIRVMTHFHPEGDWGGRGARALDSARTKTGELPFGALCEMRDSLCTQGSQSPFFEDLRCKVFFRKENSDAESQA
ncbi:hypothetical protein QN277_011910 [Acacia crassicarpa]|nr:hypothetical protein QN277_011910 [Acacia crassicarpa]